MKLIELDWRKIYVGRCRHSGDVVVSFTGRFLVADTRLYTLLCRSVGKLQVLLNSERFSHHCSCPTVHGWIAAYRALFSYISGVNVFCIRSRIVRIRIFFVSLHLSRADLNSLINVLLSTSPGNSFHPNDSRCKQSLHLNFILTLPIKWHVTNISWFSKLKNCETAAAHGNLAKSR